MSLPHIAFDRKGYIWTPWVDVYWGKRTATHRLEIITAYGHSILIWRKK
jgi:hypothetical protein